MSDNHDGSAAVRSCCWMSVGAGETSTEDMSYAENRELSTLGTTLCVRHSKNTHRFSEYDIGESVHLELDM